MRSYGKDSYGRADSMGFTLAVPPSPTFLIAGGVYIVRTFMMNGESRDRGMGCMKVDPTIGRFDNPRLYPDWRSWTLKPETERLGEFLELIVGGQELNALVRDSVLRYHVGVELD